MTGQESTQTRKRLLKEHLKKMIDDAIGENMAALRCPHCSATSAVRRGKDHRNRQRFKCKECAKSFTIASSSILRSSKAPLEAWLMFIDSFVEGDTLRTTASKCNISLKTAWYMKRRAIQALPPDR